MKHLIVLFVFLGCFFRGAAQTSTINIIDLSPIHMPVIDSMTNTIDTSQMKLRIGFKISDVSKANKVHILFGTSIDSGDVAMLTADFIQQGRTYSLVINGKIFPVNGYETHIETVFNNTQLRLVHFLTLFVEDKTGLMTQHLNRRMF